MRARHLLVGAVGLGVFAGCSHSQGTAAGEGGARAPQAPVYAEQPAATRPAAADDPETVAALKRKLAAYVKEMEELRAGREPTTAPAKDAGPRPVITDVPPPAATQPVVTAPPPPPAHPAPATKPVVVASAVNVPDVAPKAPSSDALERQLSRRVRENPLDMAAQLDYQMLLMLRGAQVPDMETLAGLPQDDRETVAALMDCLANFRANAASADNLLLARKVRPILELADRIRARADLSVPVVALCSSVQAFGNYEPMVASFPAGSDARTIVYAEVENFSSRLVDGGLYETRLAETMTLYDAAGHTVWTDPQVPVVDKARTRRRDFFVPRIVKLPGTLPVGKYTLKVTIVDQAAQRLAEGTVGVTIAAK